MFRDPMRWLPWVTLVAVIALFYLARHERWIEGAEGFSGTPKDSFWQRMQDIRVEDLRAFDRMLDEIQSERMEPEKVSDLEAYFDVRGISREG